MAENQNSNRKNENVRRANRIIQTRSFVLMILMGVVMFVLLFFRLFDLQITRHEELQGKAVNQQTRRRLTGAPSMTPAATFWRSPPARRPSFSPRWRSTTR